MTETCQEESREMLLKQLQVLENSLNLYSIPEMKLNNQYNVKLHQLVNFYK